MQGIGEFLSPKELYWKELIRSLKVQKRIGKHFLLGSSNKVAILSTHIELRTDMAEKFHLLKDAFAIHIKLIPMSTTSELYENSKGYLSSIK